MKRLLGIAFLIALALAPATAVAAFGLTVAGDIWQRADSANAIGTTYVDLAGNQYVRFSAGRDTAPGGNASLDLINLLPPGPDGAGRMGIDLQCSPGVTIQGCTEIVLYSTPKSDTDFRRMNLTAMADGSVRFGQESKGIYFHKPFCFANETRAGQVAAGTEDIFCYDATQRVDSSTPITIKNAHFRFDIPSRGGDINAYGLWRGGGGVEFNAPWGGAVQMLSRGLPVMNVGGNAGGGMLGFYGGPLVYKPVVTGSRAGADDVTLSLLAALWKLGLIQDATTP